MTVEINQRYCTKEVDDPFSEPYYVNVEDVRIDKKDEMWVKYSFARKNDDGTWGRSIGGVMSTMRAKDFLNIYSLHSSEAKTTVPGTTPGTAIKQLEVEDEER